MKRGDVVGCKNDLSVAKSQQAKQKCAGAAGHLLAARLCICACTRTLLQLAPAFRSPFCSSRHCVYSGGWVRNVMRLSLFSRALPSAEDFERFGGR